MSLLSFLLPQLGVSDKSEDPKIANAFTAILAWANGGIDEENLTTAYAAFVAQLVPSGLIAPYGGNAAPSNWLLCNGAAVSRGAYSKLFTAIGTTYGEGDKVTTFNVPDLRGRVPSGAGSAAGAAGATNHALGSKGGEETHTLTNAELAPHDHEIYMWLAGGATNGSPPDSTIANQWALQAGIQFVNPANQYNVKQGDVSTSGYAASPGGQPPNNLQPFTAVNFIIKA